MKTLDAFTKLAIVILLCTKPALSIHGAENADSKINIEIKRTEFDDGGIMTTKRYFRDGREVMCIQTRDIPQKGVFASLFLKHGGVRASIALEDGKVKGSIHIEPGKLVVSIKDLNNDGFLDQVALYDDDMNLLECYKRTSDDLLFPLSTFELNERSKKQKAESDARKKPQ